MQKKISEKCEWVPEALIMGGTSLLGGALNAWSNNISNKRNWARQQKMNQQNYEAQKEFYQNSIKWRKEDALRSGINPIYALGAQSANFSPSYQTSSDTPNDYSFIGNAAAQAVTAYQAQKEFELKKQGMKSEIKVNTARASYYNALAENAKEKSGGSGNGATTKTGTKKEAAFTQYQQKPNIGVIDPNSQISQESASDGIGYGVELISGSKSRAAARGLELFNKGKLNYPYWDRDPKEGGRYILKDAKNFKDWLYKMGVAKSWDYDFHKFFNWLDNTIGRGGMNDEQLQQTFIRETLDWQANHF